MKKSVYLLLFLCLIFTGCNKDKNWILPEDFKGHVIDEKKWMFDNKSKKILKDQYTVNIGRVFSTDGSIPPVIGKEIFYMISIDELPIQNSTKEITRIAIDVSYLSENEKQLSIDDVVKEDLKTNEISFVFGKKIFKYNLSEYLK